jgi:hypothetical protein
MLSNFCFLKEAFPIGNCRHRSGTDVINKNALFVVLTVRACLYAHIIIIKQLEPPVGGGNGTLHRKTVKRCMYGEVPATSGTATDAPPLPRFSLKIICTRPPRTRVSS